MGAWSGEPFGNDAAADWAWELAEQRNWSVVRRALAAVKWARYLDQDAAAIAIAAAETVAHGLGRGTQHDGYVEEVVAFVHRAGPPPRRLVKLAQQALAKSTGEASELNELWDEDPAEWIVANALLETALADTD
ncbi:DUF4259 domain-containing protein [Protaetiibacter larvae]|uniref:DUF4259 domain-containing protein n=1 Tax=Protaetiibacter larvae TaxID=2592654 RepID=A0A5C1Y8I9_9MICO|nr:DUF4259 domain-containing protein [Protaetiibacter larvae]QEO09678.1 DUF4259 domain-containing protein [Protaetiibacter larvae]